MKAFFVQAVDGKAVLEKREVPEPKAGPGQLLVVSDEHLTFQPATPVRVGDRVRVWPAHRWQHGRAADDVPDLEAEARWLQTLAHCSSV